MGDKDKTEKYAYLDQLSTEELEELLRADIESPENDNDEVIFHILEVIKKREQENPTGDTFDVEKALADFKQFYNTPEGEGLSLYPVEDKETGLSDNGQETSTPKQQQKVKVIHLSHALKIAGVVAAVVVGIFGLMVGAQAAGIDIFGAIGRWTDETFHFITSSTPGDMQGTGTNSSASEKDNEYYISLQGALDSCGITEKLAPTKYPYGFEISELKVSEVIFGDKIFCNYNGREEEFFSIQVLRYNQASDLNSHSFEKDSTGVTEYTTGGKTFYIMSNIDTTTATWSDGNSLVLNITGNISEDDIKAMIDSIGG